MEREKVHFQDKDNELVAANLSELQSIDPQLHEVVEYVIRVNGIYKDVLLYICKHPYKTREINYKLMNFLGTDAGQEWFELITRAIKDYGVEQAVLPYCVECIHQAFLSGLTVQKIDDVLASSRNLTELSENFKLLLPGMGAQADGNVPPLKGQGQNGIFFKKKLADYEGYVGIPTKVFYSEPERGDDLAIKGEADIFEIIEKIMKKVRRSFSAYQRRINTLNKILISKEETLKSMGGEKI